jgi:hypothetical protein
MKTQVSSLCLLTLIEKIQTADGLLPEVDRDVKDKMNTPYQDINDNEGHSLLVTGFAFLPFQMVVMPIQREITPSV